MANFMVYKSSAGSGKTFTLVKEYLRLALHDENKINYNYKRILAVTFTNKAAAEMKQRVIESLNGMAHHSILPETGKILREELQISEDTLRHRSKLLLEQILHNYSDFSIGTIDSFTHKIVKTFAYDLDLPVNFNLETDVQGFYEKVISELLGRIGEDPYLTHLLKEYSLNKAEDNSSWDPENNLLEFVKLLQKENAGQYLQQLNRFSSEQLEQFRKQFLQFINSYNGFLRSKSKEALDLFKEHQIETVDFWYGQSGPANFFNKCFQGNVNMEGIGKSRLTEAVSKNKWLSDNMHEINELLTPIARGLLEYIGIHNKHLVLCQILNKQIYQLMLIRKIEEISQAKKTEEQIVFIGEFNQKIFELINNEPAPFIYERLGEKYQHFLLDEFQDTSGLQWQNILPLLDNSLANGWFNLVVGDGKQSIYRWRNANVKQFASLPHVENISGSAIVSERIASLQRNYFQKNLNTNFRSVRTVVEFNNNLFQALSSSLLTNEYSSIYKDHTQEVRNNNTGYVSVHTGKIDREELEAFNLEQIRSKIASAIENGYNYSDICIISRKNRHGNIIANYLVEQNIPVVSSDSLLLKNNLEVNTLVCFLNYLNNNHDNISAAAVVNYLFQSEQISADRFSESLKKIASSHSLFDVLNELGFRIDKQEFLLKNLSDNCIQIISVLGLNISNHLYIRFFLDEVNEFLVTRNSNITQFTQWWETRQNKASVIVPENSNAVKIMTIHTSKGLEFPVVIVPFCNWEQYRENDAWVNINSADTELPVAVVKLSKKIKDAGLEDELENEKQAQFLDNLNLLYVAFTRAAECLHIIAASASSNKKQLVSKWIEDYLVNTYGTTPGNFYELGSMQKPLETKQNKTERYDLLPVEFEANNRVVKIKSSWLKNTKAEEKAKAQGILLHWILSRINSAGDIDAALDSARLEGFINLQEAASFKEKIVRITSHPLLRDYFMPGVKSKTETELITINNEILRPDKIIFTSNETIIIDYKTGAENNRKYFNQMTIYENALIEMGHTGIKKIIAYIDSGEAVVL